MNVKKMLRRGASSALLVLFAASSWATDTAFWKPYQPDENTYALLNFDAAEIVCPELKTSVEIVGRPRHTFDGKFGGAMKFGEDTALKLVPSNIFPGGTISIEAWVKLERYPEKQAYVVYRAAVVDKSPSYNPAVDRTKGFALLVDSEGAFHLETTNCLYGTTTRTSSPKGLVPLHRWVHLAGVSAVFPVSFRRLYLNGQEVAAVPIEWGQGLTVYGDEEKEPGPIYVGNNEKGDAGLDGLIDEVRIHRNIFKFWEKEDLSWTDEIEERDIPMGTPYFVEQHRPVLYLPLDGDTQPAINKLPGLKLSAKDESYTQGLRGKGFIGTLTLSAEKLLDLKEGSLEFWLYPMGVNNYSDRNRQFVSANGAFTFYIFNGGQPGSRPLSLFFYRPDGSLHFVNDAALTELHDGKWYHFLITWKGDQISLYIDGKRTASSAGQGLITARNKARCTQISFLPHERIGELDEIYIYDRALTPEEVANSYFRYRDPARLVKGVRLKPLEIRGLYLPTFDSIYCKLTRNVPEESIAEVILSLRDGQGKEIFKRRSPFTQEEQRVAIPSLRDGTYSLKVSAVSKDGEVQEGDAFTLERKRFAWEGNRLGLTDEVYPPFEPIRIEGNRASVVLRTCEMNGFGLWNRVITLDRDILGAPMSLKYRTVDGEGAWQAVQGRFLTRKPNLALYQAEARSRAVIVKTRASLEIDGCMKVEMQLLPGAKPARIEKLWLAIPLKAKEVPLFHEVTDGPRIGYSGRTPQGEGVVWDSTKAKRYRSWQNSFVPYIWLGAEERGLAWFAENDRGWITGKGGSKEPLQDILRENDRVTLRIYFVNTPATITRPRTLVFGLQASPTKPMPEGWRSKLADIPAGLSVSPWGGLHCSYQGPYRNDWQIVDKIVEARISGKVDREWFERYYKRYDPPPVFGTSDWLKRTLYFAGRAADVGPEKPLAVYQEEMAASTAREEWRFFGDEWTPEAHLYRRDARKVTPESVFRKGVNANPSHRVTFPGSYRDFGCYFANEWLRRGVSLYWDNTYPRTSYNYRTTAAYITDDGAIQPCIVMWNQREYHKRVWNLLQQWRARRKEPLEWTLHMTNTLMLPLHTWGTADLDHELARKEPFSPEWLRTETIGRQVGNYPLSLYEVYGRDNEVVKALPKAARERIEWGMRMVHEIQRHGRLEKVVRDFGYGTDEVAVHNYWSEAPALDADNEQVKWIALARPEDRAVMVVLASWSEKQVKARISFDLKNLGLDLKGARVLDAESGEVLGDDIAAPFQVTLPAPYGVRLLRVTVKDAPARRPEAAGNFPQAL